MSATLRDAYKVYIKMRIDSGIKAPDHGRLIEKYLDYLDRVGVDHINYDATQNFLLEQGTRHNSRQIRLQNNRIHVFSKWANSLTKSHNVIPKLQVKENGRRLPKIYMENDVVEIMSTIMKEHSEDTISAYTSATITGLMFATGLRTGEIFDLQNTDFDPDAKTLYVKAGKTPNDRLLPLDASVVSALAVYLKYKRKYFGLRSADFFMSDFGEMKSRHTFHRFFNSALEKLSGPKEIGMENVKESFRARPYDLRHSYAVNVLMSCYHHGNDVNQQLSKLSVLMGHSSINATYWYIESIPELLSLALKRAAK